jgi:hypothetical protein
MARCTIVVMSYRDAKGDIAEVPIAELLTLFATSKKSGRLLIEAPVGSLVLLFERGIVIAATWNGEDQPIEALIFLAKSVRTGTFELLPPR